MADTARREYFGKLLEPGLRKIFYEEFGRTPSMIGELFATQTTDNPYEEDYSIGTLGEFPLFNGTVEYDRPYGGYGKIYEFPEYAKGFAIERKLYDDDRRNIINKQPSALAVKYSRRRESDAASIFNNAFDSSYTGPDGKELCADDHPSKAYVDTGGTEGVEERSNVGTLELNHANLLTTKHAMMEFQDDRGDRVDVMPDTLLVPQALEEVAWELNTSGGKIDTSDNNPNIHQGKFKLIVWPDLTNDDAWFLIDSRYSKLFLNWFDRVPVEFEMSEEFDTLVAKYRAYARHACGFSDWLWVYGNDAS
jgi:hypothetical protein